MTVRPLDLAVDLDWADAFMAAQMGGRLQARRGELLDALDHPGFVAEIDDHPHGLLTFRRDGDECEVVVIVTDQRHVGAGTALIEALRAEVAEPIWLVTTNDNLDALRFYQRRGFRLRAIYPNGVDESRKVKPQIPAIGNYAIPMRDELELVLES